MRFRVSLELAERAQRRLPLNYQYELSSVIYRLIHSGNGEYGDWLHDHGYMDDRKQFRLFTFSNLMIERKRIEGDRMIIQSPEISMILTMLPTESIQYFINGLFMNQSFTLGDRLSKVPLRVKSIEAMPVKTFRESQTFKLLSPMVLSLKTENERYARYLSPEEPGYGELLARNLKQKYKTIHGQEHPFDESMTRFRLLSPSRKKGILIKADTPQQSRIIGYLFDFSLEAPAELMEIGYYAGFGGKNGMGFGCGEVSRLTLKNHI